MAQKTWSPEKQIELVTMFESGRFATSEMADRLGVSIPTVYNRLRRMGMKTIDLPRRYRAVVKFDFSDAEKKLICQSAEEGLKVTQIALLLNRTLGPTRRIFAELGLTTKVAKKLELGARFGALTVLGPAAPQKTYKGHFESRSSVVCDCGKSFVVFNYILRTGNTTSCGCRIHRRNPDREWVRHYCSILSGARVRNLNVAVDMKQVKHICSLPCAYCGALGLSAMKGRKAGRSDGKVVLRMNGIDRVDPAVGYELGNIVPCCIVCNRAKSNLDIQAFILWMQRIGSKQTERNVRRLAESVARQLESIAAPVDALALS